MRYCKRCILPDTKPGVVFDSDGICSACHSIALKDSIDWKSRQNTLRNMCEDIKRSNTGQYDCIVPVSGGKDSMFQVHTMKNDYGMKVLALIVVPHMQTMEGVENLNAMVEHLGVDLLKVSPRHSTLKKIRKMAFMDFGNPNYAEHRVVFASVARTALFYRIPLVVWGEDIGTEFGGNVAQSVATGSAEELVNNDLFREASFDDLVGAEIDPKELFFYHHPSKDSLEKYTVKSIYLSFFHFWDGHRHFEIAKTFGFKGRVAGPLSGNIINYDNIDEKLCEVHLWLKFVKLGFWRPTDEACYYIWNKRMTRAEAVELVREKQYEFPEEYFSDFCRYHHITEEQYFLVQESLRNHDIWVKKNGNWRLRVDLS